MGSGLMRRSGTAMLLALCAGCFTEAIDGPIPPAEIRIGVLQSGGFASRSFGFEIDGEAGVVRSTECAGSCPPAGTAIMGLSDRQIRDAAEALESAGVFRYDGRNFGTSCCDEIVMRIDYRNGRRSATLSGAPSRYPELLRDAAARLSALGAGYAPAIVEFGSSPPAWPADALTIDDASLDGPVLTLDVTHAGGCRAHAVDVVVLDGWLESFPVRAGAIVSHDARGDACEAIVHSRRLIDLTPVRRAYETSYGTGPATLVLGLTASNGTRIIEFRF